MLNRVVLIGRLTRQPELRITPNSVSVTTFTLAVDRYNNERQLTEAHYYENVTLDLAESGLNAAIADLKGGAAQPAYRIGLGAFRNLRGSAQATVSQNAGGYEIVALGILVDGSGAEKYSKKLLVTGHFEESPAGRNFRIDSWKEP